jgi:DNA modification methylase
MEQTEPVIRKRQHPGLMASATALPRNLPIEDVELKQDYVPLAVLKLPKRQVKKHSQDQIELLADNLRAFGQIKPIVVDASHAIVAGVAIYRALKQLGWARAQIVRAEHLSPEMLEAYAIADNKLAELSTFDPIVVVDIFKELQDIDLDLGLLGFEPFQIDNLFAEASSEEAAESEEVPEAPAVPVSKLGDLWKLGNHLLLCGSALDVETYSQLLGDARASMIVTDPPYNCAIPGNVSSGGKVQHDNFVMASGEMSRAEFTGFLQTAFMNLVAYSVDGSIHYICMDWRNLTPMTSAGEAAYAELKNMLVWNKGSGGRSTFYKSQHELIFVWMNGRAPHINNFTLGGNGRRNRTNVITMPGANSFSRTRQDDLAAHSTVKPTRLFADLMLDCSRRGNIVLDPFCGSGTTLLAAERTGRKARCIELDPKYVDVAIQRWQTVTGGRAIHVQSGQTYEVLAQALTSASHGELS